MSYRNHYMCSDEATSMHQFLVLWNKKIRLLIYNFEKIILGKNLSSIFCGAPNDTAVPMGTPNFKLHQKLAKKI